MTDDRTPSDTAARSPLRATAGCAALGCLVWIELSVGIAIAVLLAQALAPALAERGYNVRAGAGFLIAVGLGLIVAIYPAIWLHRLGQAARRRLGL